MTKENKSYWMEDEDQTGNFTLKGKDTFDPAKRYVGIRLQQGVPLLDRDWNELEDIRRYEELMLRKWYIGNGTPDDGFRISAVDPPANDFMISAGRCLVNGFEVVNAPSFNVYFEKYSDQKLDNLKPSTDQEPREDTVYLDVWVKEVRSKPLEPNPENMDVEVDPDLSNTNDVAEETCVRHKLVWCVRVDEGSQGKYEENNESYHHYYKIAKITRVKGTKTISEADIEDLREKKSFRNLNVLENGNVGIGTVKPGEKLEVDGNIKFTGDNLKTNVLDRITPIYIRGTGKDNHAHRILRIGSTTVYDGGGRGLRLTILKKVNHSIESDNIYDTYNKSTDSDALMNKLNAMTKDQIGILTSYDAWESKVYEGLDAAFQRVGLIKAMSTPRSGIRRPYAAIFEPGSDEQVSKAIEVLYNRGPKEPYTEIRGWLIDGSFVGSGSAPSYLVNNLGNTTSVVVNESGNVGIGTPSPSAKLHVQSDDENAQVNIWSTGVARDAVLMFGTATSGQNFYLTLDEDDDRKFKMGPGIADNKLVIQQNGNVGIGTTEPQSSLHIKASEKTRFPLVTENQKLDNMEITPDLIGSFFESMSTNSVILGIPQRDELVFFWKVMDRYGRVKIFHAALTGEALDI